VFYITPKDGKFIMAKYFKNVVRTAVALPAVFLINGVVSSVTPRLISLTQYYLLKMDQQLQAPSLSMPIFPVIMLKPFILMSVLAKIIVSVILK